jgi:tetratricopeptide (TPR) repeat protein
MERYTNYRRWGWVTALIMSSFMPLVTGLSPAWASDYSRIVEAEIATYKRGDYAKSLKYGIYALKLKPTDAIVRYYLAASLVNLNRKDEAVKQYEQAAAFTHDSQLLANIQAGLTNLTKDPAPVATKVTTSSPKNSPKDAPKAKPEEPSDLPKELTSAQKQAKENAAREIEVFRKEADREIANIHNEEANQLSGVEQYQWKETETNGRAERVYEQSPAYTALFEKLQKADEPRISEINERYLNHKAQIENAAKLRISAYEAASTNEKSQFKMGNGLTQVMPLGSNLYVRNIINYGTENRLPELKGRMQSLENVTPVPSSASKSPSSNTEISK